MDDSGAGLLAAVAYRCQQIEYSILFVRSAAICQLRGNNSGGEMS
ncbi:hypothetical protein [Rhabdaerophilum calidifontis]|nr:hypothetical protein [Rhabdaerophilum calidifontis]